MSCRYYKLGTCKFGNNCNWSHDNYSNNYGYYNSGNYNYDKYHVDNRKKYTSADLGGMDIPSFMEAMKTEMEQLENGHMWPLTSIGPRRDHNNLPGFDDISPEEDRYEFYNAYKSGTMGHYRRNITDVRDKAKMNRNMYKMKSSGAFEIVKAYLAKKQNANSGFVDTMQINTTPVSETFSFQRGPVSPLYFPSIQQGTNSMSQPSTQSAFNTFSFSRLSRESKSEPICEEAEMSNDLPQILNQSNSVFNASNPFIKNTQSANASAGNMFLSSTNISNANDDYAYPHQIYTDHEIEAFNAKAFKLGHIPLKSPPKEYCFCK